MGKLIQSLRRIPYWAYLLVILVILVNTAYLVYRDRIPIGGATVKVENGYYIHDYVIPGSSVYKGGIRPGDTLVSMNSIPIEEWEYSLKVGDTVVAGVLRNNQEVGMPVVVGSLQSFAPGFFWSIYIVVIFFSIGSLYILYEKTNEKSAKLFFIIIQLFMVLVNGLNLQIQEPIAMSANIAFFLCSCFIGPALIQFHLLFPKPAKFFSKLKRFPWLFYALGFLIFSIHAMNYSYFLITTGTSGPFFYLFERIVVLWMTLTFTLALAIVIFQFRTVKDTLSRNQLRIVITGTFFGFITPMSISLFYNSFIQFSAKYPLMSIVSQGTGTLILISCILIAIFRYRIWDMEVLIRKALLYLSATIVIILAYLFLLYLVDLSTIRETRITRFVILALSVIIFLIFRDLIQRLIDRMFHRETYDSATVVSDFEAKLAGVYRFDELREKIVQGMDEIFHFKFLMFNLKKSLLCYEPVCTLGNTDQSIQGEFQVNDEFELKMLTSRVFSPAELKSKPLLFDHLDGELVVPLLSGDHPDGFFICGAKQSERIYSLQDIRVLSLLARRVVSLLHTASLYQKDLDRQLMLERERTRISQDMHDDVGASLTRISMMSDLVKNRTDIGGGAREWLGKISDTSRGLMEEMNQIIWALNPRNDNLEGLITYVRRFAFEYLEPTSVSCVFDLPAEMPNLSLSVEVRRNVYLVVREAIHNVVKHAGATEVVITFSFTSPTKVNDLTPQPHLLQGEGAKGERSFTISIRDNGNGFDPAALEFPGNGLTNMNKRMYDIGGEFFIYSHPGEGTEIKLIVH
ncbi:MAG: hypothetical protein IH596_14395 [Bacteroidales bacterium]|nr:hypothetical protein [Bacteroidales bacterium]